MTNTIINPIVNDTAIFLQTAEGTQNQLTEIEIHLGPDGGNTLHIHKTFEETFTAVDGVLGLRAGYPNTKTILLQPGESFTVPIGMAHHYFNPGKSDIRFNIKLNPGHTGFEKSLRIVYGLARDGKTNKNSRPNSIYHMAVLAEIGELSLPGPLGLLDPVIHLLAKRAEKLGVKRELLEKYCA